MRLLVFGFCLLPLLVGCGKSKAVVSGRVLYNGKPLPGGTVLFRPVDLKQNAVLADLDEQGHFEATLPLGEVQVAVDNRELQPLSPAPTGIPPDLPADAREALSKGNKPTAPAEVNNPNAPTKKSGKYVAIPNKYYAIESSGLKFMVAGGTQTHDIELK